MIVNTMAQKHGANTRITSMTKPGKYECEVTLWCEQPEESEFECIYLGICDTCTYPPREFFDGKI